MDHIQPLGDLILSPDDVQVYILYQQERESGWFDFWLR